MAMRDGRTVWHRLNMEGYFKLLFEFRENLRVSLERDRSFRKQDAYSALLFEIKRQYPEATKILTDPIGAVFTCSDMVISVTLVDDNNSTFLKLNKL